MGCKFGPELSNTFECRHKPLHSTLQHLKLAAWLKTCVENSALLGFLVLNAPGKMMGVFPGALSTEKHKSAEISTQVFSHAASFRCCRVLCSGLWRHSKVFDSSGPNLHPKNYLHPYGTNGSGEAKNLHFFGPKFLHGVPLGANTFRWGECPKKGRKGPKCVPKQV